MEPVENGYYFSSELSKLTLSYSTSAVRAFRLGVGSDILCEFTSVETDFVSICGWDKVFNAYVEDSGYNSPFLQVSIFHKQSNAAGFSHKVRFYVLYEREVKTNLSLPEWSLNNSCTTAPVRLNYQTFRQSFPWLICGGTYKTDGYITEAGNTYIQRTPVRASYQQSPAVLPRKRGFIYWAERRSVADATAPADGRSEVRVFTMPVVQERRFMCFLYYNNYGYPEVIQIASKTKATTQTEQQSAILQERRRITYNQEIKRQWECETGNLPLPVMAHYEAFLTAKHVYLLTDCDFDTALASTATRSQINIVDYSFEPEHNTGAQFSVKFGFEFVDPQQEHRISQCLYQQTHGAGDITDDYDPDYTRIFSKQFSAAFV